MKGLQTQAPNVNDDRQVLVLLVCKHLFGQGVDYSPLDLRLQVTSAADVARNDDQDLVQDFRGLNTDGRGCRWLSNDGKEMSNDGVPGNLWVTVDKAVYVKEGDISKPGYTVVSRFLKGNDVNK